MRSENATVSRDLPTPGSPKRRREISGRGMVGALAALRRRATEGGSYRVRVSLARVSLWLLQMGIFDKSYATDVAGGAGDHAYPDPDLFEVETPCGHYQGVTDQVVMSRKPHGAPHGSFSVAGPMVRIHLPPAASQVRTCLLREFAFLRREAAVFRGCAGRGSRRGRQRRARRGNIGPTSGNISVAPYSSTAPPVMWAA
jgi:hypothetical protein